ncbi:MAG: hypothetical protein VXY89_13685, partial [SAR324 cluster bacterium]|nr:hypothetical protein [SAR324 cluster bacterium]
SLKQPYWLDNRLRPQTGLTGRLPLQNSSGIQLSQLLLRKFYVDFIERSEKVFSTTQGYFHGMLC